MPRITALLSVLALAAVLLHERGWYVVDNPTVFYWAPSRVLGGLADSWDPTLDFGGPPQGYSPGIYLFVGALRLAGAEPWLAQRLFHAFLIIAGGVGCACVARALAPRAHVAHATAALVYAFCPLSVTYLLPSWLYMNYALAPWLLVAFLHGVRGAGAGRWRWAAVFALCMAFSGALNPPGAVYSMLPFVPTAVYLVHFDRRWSWQDVFRWTIAASALTIVVLAPGVFRMLAGSGQLTQNLAHSESAEAVSLSSSWSESWRGLGFWLSYWGGPAIRHTTSYFTNPLVAILSFFPSCVAIAVIWRSRWRPRILLGAMMLLGLAIMVGAYPVSDPTPYGHVLLNAFNVSTVLFAFRNSYKAGALFMIGVAVLCGVGAQRVVRRTARWQPRLRRVPALLVVAAFVIASGSPLWSGAVYHDSERVRDIPDYYTNAIDWLDAQPGQGRVLILPLALQDRYRWASTPDFDLFSPLLQRPQLKRSILSPSGPVAGNLISELSDWMATSSEAPVALTPIARRLGIEFVLVRNDLEWERLEMPPPQRMRELIDGPGVTRVVSFGTRGENLAPDASGPSDGEQALSPVEIYRVDGVTDTARIIGNTPSLLVSGDGGAWGPLAENGLLEGSGPLQYTGQLSADGLTREFNRGAGLIVTDTNRRRAGGFGPGSSTLTAEANPRGTQRLFDRPGSESTVVYTDAREIVDESPATLFPVGRANRAASAFDGDPTTAWYTGRMDPLPRSSLHIDLREPKVVGTATLVAALPTDGSRRVTTAVLSFSEGDPVTVKLPQTEATVSFAPRRTQWIDVHIESVGGFGLTAVGFSEISFPGLDLREFIHVPDDVFRAAGENDSLAVALRSAPVTYEFRRLAGTDSDEERALWREFAVSDTRRFTLDGQLALDETVPDDVLASLVDRDVRGYGSDRYPRAVSGSGLFAVDGRYDTGWNARPEAGSRLTLTFPTQPVTELDVAVELGDAVTDIQELAVTIGSITTNVAVPADGASCASNEFDDHRRCVEVVVNVPSVVTDAATVDITHVEAVPRLGTAKPARILEVRVNATDNVALPATPASTCVRAGLVIEGNTIPIELTGSLSDLFAGRSLAFHGCDDPQLDAGVRRLESNPGFLLDRVRLAAGTLPSAPSDAGAIKTEVLSQSSSALRLRFSAPGGARIISGQAFDGRWRASIDGRSLGASESLDGFSGWTVDGTMIAGQDAVTVAIELPQANWYRWAVVVSGLGVAACILLIVYNPGRASRLVRVVAHGRRRRITLVALFAVIVAYLFAGPAGAVVAAAGAVVAIRRSEAAPALVFGALLMVALAALWTIPPLGPSRMASSPAFATERPLAHGLGQMAAVLLMIGVSVSAARERSASRVHRSRRPKHAAPRRLSATFARTRGRHSARNR